MTAFRRISPLLAALCLLCNHTTLAGPVLVAMGDSVSEGVQAADASYKLQQSNYLSWIARKMDAKFYQPLIVSNPAGSVGTTAGRFRMFPSYPSHNLAVSGSDLDDLFSDAADASSVEEIDSETDLVLYPRTGTPIAIAQAWHPAPDYIICWSGNNEILRTVAAWDSLDASQMTSIEEFAEDFNEVVQGLSTTGSKLVFANIPDVTRIGFVFDNQDLEKYLGLKNALPQGSRTTLIAMLMIRLGLADASLFDNPDYVLDSREINLIQQRIAAYNWTIGVAAAKVNAPVVNVHGILQGHLERPPQFMGVPVTSRFLGGWLSLDGIHPSNTGHAMLANHFIKTINSHYDAQIPEIHPLELIYTYLADPHIDKDGDGLVVGRPLEGILETLGPALGITGDSDDRVANPERYSADLLRWLTLSQYWRYRGHPWLWNLDEEELARRALEEAFGLAKIY